MFVCISKYKRPLCTIMKYILDYFYMAYCVIHICDNHQVQLLCKTYSITNPLSIGTIDKRTRCEKGSRNVTMIPGAVHAIHVILDICPMKKHNGKLISLQLYCVYESRIGMYNGSKCFGLMETGLLAPEQNIVAHVCHIYICNMTPK